MFFVQVVRPGTKGHRPGVPGWKTGTIEVSTRDKSAFSVLVFVASRTWSSDLPMASANMLTVSFPKEKAKQSSFTLLGLCFLSTGNTASMYNC